jgi:hypothetical protein
MARQNIDRQNDLEPKRMEYAKNKLQELGCEVTFVGNTTITFVYKKEIIHFFPYSGWHSGKSIKDGRGLNNLLKQLKNDQ